MNKKAILINSIGVNHDIVGTRLDVKNFERFLVSDIGGQWNSNEIMKIEDPSSDYIEDLSTLNLDYTLMMISCHGGIYVKDKRLYLELGGIDLNLFKFFNKSKKQMIVLDCCRSEFGEDELFLEHKSIFKASSTSDVPRKLYEEKINRADEGLVCVASCSSGQVSHILNESGSFFINALLDGVFKHEINNRIVIDIKEALEISKDILKKEYPSDQIPEMVLGEKRNKWFPFAVV